MKKILIALLLLSLLLPAALAEDIDLSGLTYDQLVALKDRINKAMWECDEWQEVTVPAGVWKIGEDIPAGHWTMKVAPGSRWVSVHVGDTLNDTGKGIAFLADRYWGESVKPEGSDLSTIELTELDFEFLDGDYLVIEEGDLVFTPYTGKQSLGFK